MPKNVKQAPNPRMKQGGMSPIVIVSIGNESLRENLKNLMTYAEHLDFESPQGNTETEFYSLRAYNNSKDIWIRFDARIEPEAMRLVGVSLDFTRVKGNTFQPSCRLILNTQNDGDLSLWYATLLKSQLEKAVELMSVISIVFGNCGPKNSINFDEDDE